MLITKILLFCHAFLLEVSLDENGICSLTSYNPGQNIWNKEKKIQQNWTELENFDINFCLLFAIAKIKILKWILGTRLCVQPNMKDNLYTKFVTLDIRFRFAFGGPVLKHYKVSKYYDQDCWRLRTVLNMTCHVL